MCSIFAETNFTRIVKPPIIALKMNDMREQKYKIYINGKPVSLTTTEGMHELGIQAAKNVHVAYYIGKKKTIKQYLDLLDKNRVRLWSARISYRCPSFTIHTCFQLKVS